MCCNLESMLRENFAIEKSLLKEQDTKIVDISIIWYANSTVNKMLDLVSD